MPPSSRRTPSARTTVPISAFADIYRKTTSRKPSTPAKTPNDSLPPLASDRRPPPPPTPGAATGVADLGFEEGGGEAGNADDARTGSRGSGSERRFPQARIRRLKREQSLRVRERMYDVNLVTTHMPTYEPLLDEYLQDYLGSPATRHHLLNVGLIDPEGHIVEEKEFKYNQIRLQRLQYENEVLKRKEDRDLDREIEVAIRQQTSEDKYSCRSQKLRRMKTLDVTAVRPFPDFLSHYPVTMWKTALLYAEKPAPLMDAEQMLLSRLKAQSPSKLRALGLSPEEIYEKPFRSRKRVVKSAAASRGQRDESAEKMGTAEGFVVENEHSLPATSIDNDLGAAILPSQFSNTSSSAILSSSMQAVSPPSSVSVQKQDTEKLSSVSRPETAEKGTEIDDPNMEETIRSCLTKAGLKKLSKSEKLLVEHIIRLGGDVDEIFQQIAEHRSATPELAKAASDIVKARSGGGSRASLSPTPSLPSPAERVTPPAAATPPESLLPDRPQSAPRPQRPGRPKSARPTRLSNFPVGSNFSEFGSEAGDGGGGGGGDAEGLLQGDAETSGECAVEKIFEEGVLSGELEAMEVDLVPTVEAFRESFVEGSEAMVRAKEVEEDAPSAVESEKEERRSVKSIRSSLRRSARNSSVSLTERKPEESTKSKEASLSPSARSSSVSFNVPAEETDSNGVTHESNSPRMSLGSPEKTDDQPNQSGSRHSLSPKRQSAKHSMRQSQSSVKFASVAQNEESDSHSPTEAEKSSRSNQGTLSKAHSLRQSVKSLTEPEASALDDGSHSRRSSRRSRTSVNESAVSGNDAPNQQSHRSSAAEMKEPEQSVRAEIFGNSTGKESNDTKSTGHSPRLSGAAASGAENRTWSSREPEEGMPTDGRASASDLVRSSVGHVQGGSSSKRETPRTSIRAAKPTHTETENCNSAHDEVRSVGDETTRVKARASLSEADTETRPDKPLSAKQSLRSSDVKANEVEAQLHSPAEQHSEPSQHSHENIPSASRRSSQQQSRPLSATSRTASAAHGIDATASPRATRSRASMRSSQGAGEEGRAPSEPAASGRPSAAANDHVAHGEQQPAPESVLEAADSPMHRVDDSEALEGVAATEQTRLSSVIGGTGSSRASVAKSDARRSQALRSSNRGSNDSLLRRTLEKAAAASSVDNMNRSSRSGSIKRLSDLTSRRPSSASLNRAKSNEPSAGNSKINQESGTTSIDPASIPLPLSIRSSVAGDSSTAADDIVLNKEPFEPATRALMGSRISDAMAADAASIPLSDSVRSSVSDAQTMHTGPAAIPSPLSGQSSTYNNSQSAEHARRSSNHSVGFSPLAPSTSELAQEKSHSSSSLSTAQTNPALIKLPPSAGTSFASMSHLETDPNPAEEGPSSENHEPQLQNLVADLPHSKKASARSSAISVDAAGTQQGTATPPHRNSVGAHEVKLPSPTGHSFVSLLGDAEAVENTNPALMKLPSAAGSSFASLSDALAKTSGPAAQTMEETISGPFHGEAKSLEVDPASIRLPSVATSSFASLSEIVQEQSTPTPPEPAQSSRSVSVHARTIELPPPSGTSFASLEDLPTSRNESFHAVNPAMVKLPSGAGSSFASLSQAWAVSEEPAETTSTPGQAAEDSPSE